IRTAPEECQNLSDRSIDHCIAIGCWLTGRRNTGVKPLCWGFKLQGIRLRARELDHLGHFLGFLGDQLPEAGRARKRNISCKLATGPTLGDSPFGDGDPSHEKKIVRVQVGERDTLQCNRVRPVMGDHRIRPHLRSM
ncbi:MAG: hypothetical protein QOG25_1484, partial [Acetobacteraceae bacterium]|nr:hypothetical protein [Acetobacteraceae bacterium]